jgi:hypothetical protein
MTIRWFVIVMCACLILAGCTGSAAPTFPAPEVPYQSALGMFQYVRQYVPLTGQERISGLRWSVNSQGATDLLWLQLHGGDFIHVEGGGGGRWAWWTATGAQIGSSPLVADVLATIDRNGGHAGACGAIAPGETCEIILGNQNGEWFLWVPGKTWSVVAAQSRPCELVEVRHETGHLESPDPGAVGVWLEVEWECR